MALSLLYLVNLPFVCDFETGYLCGMTQGTSNNYDWIRMTGSYLTPNTGPSGAISGSYYMLMNASAAIIPGYQAMYGDRIKYNAIQSSKNTIQNNTVIFNAIPVPVFSSFQFFLSIPVLFINSSTLSSLAEGGLGAPLSSYLEGALYK